MEYTLYLEPQFVESKNPKQNRVKSRIWVLFSGTICMIFFDHYFVYLISSYVMVMFFPQVFKS